MLGSPTELKRNQVFAGRRKDLMARFSDKDHVFNPYTTLIRYVDAWFNCNDHTRHKFLGLAACQSRRLVHLNSHSMPG